jgi:hypothetical protein
MPNPSSIMITTQPPITNPQQGCFPERVEARLAWSHRPASPPGVVRETLTTMAITPTGPLHTSLLRVAYLRSGSPCSIAKLAPPRRGGDLLPRPGPDQPNSGIDLVPPDSSSGHESTTLPTYFAPGLSGSVEGSFPSSLFELLLEDWVR